MMHMGRPSWPSPNKRRHANDNHQKVHSPTADPNPVLPLPMQLRRRHPYYTRIDNTRIEEQTPSGGVIDPTGGMPYRYTLTAYGEKGSKTELSFGTSRILREGAYLKLTTLPMRGVTNWEEVAWEDLPEQVQEQFPQ